MEATGGGINCWIVCFTSWKVHILITIIQRYVSLFWFINTLRTGDGDFRF